MKIINLAINRSMVCKYEKQLRRARSLYTFFCRHELKKNPMFIIEMADRGRMRGLWSINNHNRNVRQSIQSHLFKLHCKHIEFIVTNGDHVQRWDTWGDWLRREGWDSWTGLPTGHTVKDRRTK